MDFIKLIMDLEYGKKQNNLKSKGVFHEFCDPQKWKVIKESDYYQDMINEIYRSGEYYTGQPLVELPYSLYKLYNQTGSRREYENVYFDRRGRLSTFAILSILEPGNKSYVSQLEDVLWAICNEYTWVLPAHLDEGGLNVIYNKSVLKEDGKMQSYPREHRYDIDLFAAETAFALAEITSLLEYNLTDQICYRVREEIYRRIFKPYTKLNNIFHWEQLPMNWAAVCSGSIGAAAIYLIEESKVLAGIMQRVLNTMDVFISGFPEDGVCQEGLGYWNYGFGFYTYFAELLKDRTAGKINLMDSPKIKEIALFQQKSYISADKVISFSDSPRYVKFHAGLSSRLNKIYADFKLPDIKYKAGFYDDKCHRWPHIIRDIIWFTPEAYNSMKEHNERSVYYFEESQWLIYKQRGIKGDIVFAAKGGNNGEPHNHNDIGSFLYHIDGTAFLIDLGSGQYTRDYFGPHRYEILCNGSQGHSLPIIEGDLQQYGSDYFAEFCTYESTETKIQFGLEIAGAYNNENLRSLFRSYNISNKDNNLTIQDKYQFREKPTSIVERFISLIKPELTQKGRLQLKSDNSFLIIIFDHQQLRYSCSKEYHINHDGNKEAVFLIDFSVKNTSKKESIQFKFIPSFK